jgi:hypothetical protein
MPSTVVAPGCYKMRAMDREGKVPISKPLNPEAGDEMRQLRVKLRDRQSIDRLARAWTSGLVFILLVGIWIKLQHDSDGHPLFLWPAALLCVAVLGHAVREALLGFRMLREDRLRLQRLRSLEARAPAPPELF